MIPSQSTALADHTHARVQPLSVDTGAFTSDVYGTTTVAIDPDDAASAGTAATVSRSDHAHEFTTATAVALTKTATSSEGSSGDGARADHVHATNALPWGIVTPRQSLTTSNGPHAGDATTDLSLASVSVDSSRLYRVVLHAEWQVSAGAVWDINFHVGGTLTDTLANINTAGAGTGTISNEILWEPSTGTPTVDVRADFISGGTLTLNGSATGKRHFWIEDIGPR